MKWAIAVVGVMLIGCAEPNLESRSATESDTPFGGGFPASQHPDGDPFGKNAQRQEIRPLQPIQPIQPQQPQQPQQPDPKQYPVR
jgi:hypothetical protein